LGRGGGDDSVKKSRFLTGLSAPFGMTSLFPAFRSGLEPMLPVSGLAAGVGDGHDLDDAGGTFAVNQSKWKFPEQEPASRVRAGRPTLGKPRRSGSARARLQRPNLRAASGLRSRYQSKAASYRRRLRHASRQHSCAWRITAHAAASLNCAGVLPTMGWSSLCRNLVPRCACQSRPPRPLARPRQLCRRGLKSENPPELPVPQSKAIALFPSSRETSGVIWDMRASLGLCLAQLAFAWAGTERSRLRAHPPVSFPQSHL